MHRVIHDYRIGRDYIEVLIKSPPRYAGEMRLYTDRIRGVLTTVAAGAQIAWMPTGDTSAENCIVLTTTLSARILQELVWGPGRNVPPGKLWRMFEEALAARASAVM